MLLITLPFFSSLVLIPSLHFFVVSDRYFSAAVRKVGYIKTFCFKYFFFSEFFYLELFHTRIIETSKAHIHISAYTQVGICLYIFIHPSISKSVVQLVCAFAVISVFIFYFKMFIFFFVEPFSSVLQRKIVSWTSFTAVLCSVNGRKKRQVIY